LLVFAQGLKLLDEVAQVVFDVEFVRVRVCLGGFFELIDHDGSVLKILGGVEYDLFLLLFVHHLGLFLCLLFCFFGGQLLLLFDSFLLVLAELNLTFLSGFLLCCWS
jgi:hypothetical protein